jgi:putative component of membrane protein insertase Oxa1/YidC/SpoIIIJ protein YidD
MNFKSLIILAFFCYNTNAQSLNSDSFLNNSFNHFEHHKSPLRGALSFKERSIWYKINPLSYVSIGFMFTYQRFVSQQLGSECSYETSCSEHAKKSVEKHGIFKGIFLGFYQFQSCTSKAGYDHPDHTINKKGKIINPVELKDD